MTDEWDEPYRRPQKLYIFYWLGYTAKDIDDETPGLGEKIFH
jgi:hypothetical protein